MSRQKRTEQFLPILKKDLKMVFTKKGIVIMFLSPFIVILLITLIPTLFESSTQTTITVGSLDIGSTEQHVNGTEFFINIGESVTTNIRTYFYNHPSVEINIVNSRGEALNSSLGIWIPSNFTEAAFDGQASFEYRQATSSASILSSYFRQALNKIYETVEDYFLLLNLEENIPTVAPVFYESPFEDPTSGSWKSSTLDLARPYAYIIMLFASLSVGMGKSIGFAKEREDGTLETLLTISKNQSHLVLSKLITGALSSLVPILSYFAGAALGGLPARGSDSETLIETLIFPVDVLLSIKGILLIISVALSLSFAMALLITFETSFSKPVADGLGIPIVLGLGAIFFFPIVINPETNLFIVHLNPFHWVYHSFLSMIDLSFGWIDALYLGLFVALFAGLVFIAARSIGREKILYT